MNLFHVSRSGMNGQHGFAELICFQSPLSYALLLCSFSLLSVHVCLSFYLLMTACYVSCPFSCGCSVILSFAEYAYYCHFTHAICPPPHSTQPLGVCPLSFSSTLLPSPPNRHLCQSPCCCRWFLWSRPVGSFSLCLLEAVLAHLEEQGPVIPCGQLRPGCTPWSASAHDIPVSACRHRDKGGAGRQAAVTTATTEAAWGGGEEAKSSGGEGQWPQLSEAARGSHEDQPDLARHSSRGAAGSARAPDQAG